MGAALALGLEFRLVLCFERRPELGRSRRSFPNPQSVADDDRDQRVVCDVCRALSVARLLSRAAGGSSTLVRGFSSSVDRRSLHSRLPSQLTLECLIDKLRCYVAWAGLLLLTRHVIAITLVHTFY